MSIKLLRKTGMAGAAIKRQALKMTIVDRKNEEKLV